MVLYHGSNVSGIEALKPGRATGPKPCVYMTHSKVLATIYSHNPLTRPNGFFPYWWGKDGKLYYDEYFRGQLEEIYSGQKGYVYECEGEYSRMEQMPWVYVAEQQVPVVNCTVVPDIYEQLLRYEKEGLLIIQRWDLVSQGQRELWKKVVRNSLKRTDLSTPAGMEYLAYVRKHFPDMDVTD